MMFLNFFIQPPPWPRRFLSKRRKRRGLKYQVFVENSAAKTPSQLSSVCNETAELRRLFTQADDHFVNGSP